MKKSRTSTNKTINNPFIAKYPELDLHGETSFSSPVLINSFIKDCIHLKEYNAIIIHGKGTGILRKATHEYLKKDKRIQNYYIDSWNEGQTIISIKKS